MSNALTAAVDHLLDVATGHRNMTQDEADAHREAIAQDTPAPPAPATDTAADDTAQPVTPPPAPGPETAAQAPAVEG
jgi:hypothetical protein